MTLFWGEVIHLQNKILLLTKIHIFSTKASSMIFLKSKERFKNILVFSCEIYMK